MKCYLIIVLFSISLIINWGQQFFMCPSAIFISSPRTAHSYPLSIFLLDSFLFNTVVLFREVVLNGGMLESPGRLFKQWKEEKKEGMRGGEIVRVGGWI